MSAYQLHSGNRFVRQKLFVEADEFFFPNFPPQQKRLYNLNT